MTWQDEHGSRWQLCNYLFIHFRNYFSDVYHLRSIRLNIVNMFIDVTDIILVLSKGYAVNMSDMLCFVLHDA